MADQRIDVTNLGFLGVIVALLVGFGRSASTPRLAGGSAADSSTMTQNALLNATRLRADPTAELRSMIAGARTTEMLIVTVPDPIDSRGDWGFDAALQSIRRAHERSGFVLDRFWLPWLDDRRLLRAGTASEIRRRSPGVLLFRSSGEAESLRLVFLVGEVPTAGVHPEALKTALDTWLALTEGGRPRTMMDQRIRLVAPYHSGAAPSVIHVLHDWWTRHGLTACDFDVVSGTATSANLVQSFRESAIRFRRTIHSDADKQRLLDTALARMGYSRREVALLVESSTGYGQGLIAQDDSSQQRSRNVPVRRSTTPFDRISERCKTGKPQQSALKESPQAADTPPAGVVGNQKPGDSLRHTNRLDSLGSLRVPIPLGIASLRMAYERGHRGEQPLPVPGRRTSAFDVSLEDPEWAVDHPPPFASRLTPAILDELLDNLARLMAARGVRAVGIQATDIRDKLFLAQEVKRRMPGVQLFTFEGSVLYTWPAYQDALRGMLVVTSYPLVLELQESMHRYGDYEALPFSSSSAEGLYNAVVEHLGARKALEDYSFPNRLSTSPPLWLTAIGRHVVIPIWADSANRKGSGVVQAGIFRTPWRVRPSFPWKHELLWPWLLAFVLAALLWVARSARRVQHLREKLPGISALDDRAMLIHSASLVLHWHMYAAYRACALGAMAALASAWLWCAAGDHPFAVMVLPPIVVALTFAGYHCFVMAQTWVKYFRQGWGFAFHHGEWDSWRHRLWWHGELLSRAVVFLSLPALTVLFIWIGVVVARMSDLESHLFRLRAVALGSGLSLLMPLGFGGAGLVFWAAWHLRRINLLAGAHAYEAWALNRVSFLPLVRSEHYEDRAGVAARVAEIRMRLFATAYGPVGWVLFAALLFVGGVLLFAVHGSVEGAAELTARLPVMLVLCACIAASFGSLAWGGIRLFQVWQAFRRTLVDVCTTPLLGAFERLPDRVAALARITLLGPADKRVLPVMASNQWQRVVALWPTAQGELRARESQTALVRLGDDTFKAAKIAPTLERTLPLGGGCATAYKAVDEILELAWRPEPSPLPLAPPVPPKAGADSQGATAPAATGSQQWVRALEDFVALHFVEYAEWVIEHLRNMATFLVIGLTLALLLVSSYTAFDGRWLQYACFAILFSTVFMLLYVLVQLNRDEVLSRITGTDPGKVTWDARFMFNVMALVALPAIALLSSVFPAVREFLSSWVNPVMHSMPR